MSIDAHTSRTIAKAPAESRVLGAVLGGGARSALLLASLGYGLALGAAAAQPSAALILSETSRSLNGYPEMAPADGLDTGIVEDTVSMLAGAVAAAETQPATRAASGGKLLASAALQEDTVKVTSGGVTSLVAIPGSEAAPVVKAASAAKPINSPAQSDEQPNNLWTDASPNREARPLISGIGGSSSSPAEFWGQTNADTSGFVTSSVGAASFPAAPISAPANNGSAEAVKRTISPPSALYRLAGLASGSSAIPALDLSAGGFSLVSRKRYDDFFADGEALAPLPPKEWWTVRGGGWNVGLPNDQFDCLARAVYFEARGESAAGQIAVAKVILNRVRHSRFPGNVCDVVYQGAKKKHRCQFSFACDGKADRPRDERAFNKAKAHAAKVLTGKAPLPAMHGATHYHADYVKPSWASAMGIVGHIGRHIFYTMDRERRVVIPRTNLRLKASRLVASSAPATAAASLVTGSPRKTAARPRVIQITNTAKGTTAAPKLLPRANFHRNSAAARLHTSEAQAIAKRVQNAQIRRIRAAALNRVRERLSGKLNRVKVIKSLRSKGASVALEVLDGAIR